MRKQFEFVKVAGIWFCWLPNYIGNCMDLSMVDGADELLDSIDSKFVRLQMVNPDESEIILSKIKEDSCGATYEYKGKNVWLCNVTLLVLGEFPQNIYLKNVTEIN